MGNDRRMFRTFKLKDADVTIVIWCYQGSDLKLGATESDYRVTIGDDECPIAVVTSHVLRCRPAVPQKLSDNESQRPVTVSAWSTCQLSFICTGTVGCAFYHSSRTCDPRCVLCTVR